MIEDVNIETKRIVLLGASGHGKVCGEIAKMNGFSEILYLDDDTSIELCGRYKVVGKVCEYSAYMGNDTVLFVSIGNADIRKRLQEDIRKAGGNIATLIHPDAVVGNNVSIGDGTVVMAGVVINPGTKIGRGCIINTSSSVDHDCVIGDYVHVAVGAHICGGVHIGRKTWVGAGAIVNNYHRICGNCLVGSGAVVINDIEEQGTYVGVPAKRIVG